MHNVVITGLGAVTPHGNTVSENWTAVCQGKSGISLLPEELVFDLPVKIGGTVKNFAPSNFVSKAEQKRLENQALFAIKAGLEAMQSVQDDLGKHPFDPWKFGVYVGSSAGPVAQFINGQKSLTASGPRAVSPGVALYGGSDAAASFLSIRLNARGTTAGFAATCASGSTALGEAMRAIRHGYLDQVLVIGSDDCLNRVNLASNSVIHSLARDFNDRPQAASRPFDLGRAGFVMSQGAAAILLENETPAKARNATILAKLQGYGSTSDAHHATAPDPEADGAINAMLNALADAKVLPTEIDHVSAHGTSTPKGDLAEIKALQKIFGCDVPPITALKSMTGHLLGAAGIFEAVIAVKTLENNLIPPTINLDNPEFEVDIVTRGPRKKDLNLILSNSFGFGGHNSSLVISRG